MINQLIKDKVQELDNDFVLLKSKKAFGNIYYIEDRLRMHIDEFADDKLITSTEIQKYIRYDNVSLFIKVNNKYYLNGLYPVDLSQYIVRLDIKQLANKIMIKKEHLQHFIDFAEWWEEVKEIRKKKSEYRKAIKKYYGNPADATKECIAVNYNCSECINIDTCKLIKCEITQKQFAKAVSLFYGDKHTFGKNSIIAENQELKSALNKLEKQKEQILQKKDELKKQVERLEKYKKSVNFTKQEITLFDLVLQGYKQTEIAEVLEVTNARIHTIKNKVFRKLRTIGVEQ